MNMLMVKMHQKHIFGFLIFLKTLKIKKMSSNTLKIYFFIFKEDIYKIKIIENYKMGV
jgi:hypothetical protein